MSERIKHVIRRAQFAAIGGGIDGLVGRNAASTGASCGALTGATVAEKMGPVDARKERLDRGVEVVEVGPTVVGLVVDIGSNGCRSVVGE